MPEDKHNQDADSEPDESGPEEDTAADENENTGSDPSAIPVEQHISDAHLSEETFEAVPDDEEETSSSPDIEGYFAQSDQTVQASEDRLGSSERHIGALFGSTENPLPDETDASDPSDPDSGLQVNFKEQLEVDSSGTLTATIFGNTFRFVNTSRLRTAIDDIEKSGTWTTFYLGIATLTGGISATTFTTWGVGGDVPPTTLAVLLTIGISTLLITLLFLALFGAQLKDTSAKKDDVKSIIDA